MTVMKRGESAPRLGQKSRLCGVLRHELCNVNAKFKVSGFNLFFHNYSIKIYFEAIALRAMSSKGLLGFLLMILNLVCAKSAQTKKVFAVICFINFVH